MEDEPSAVPASRDSPSGTKESSSGTHDVPSTTDLGENAFASPVLSASELLGTFPDLDPDPVGYGLFGSPGSGSGSGSGSGYLVLKQARVNLFFSLYNIFKSTVLAK